MRRSGSRSRATLAQLRQQYGAALIPPGHADSPDLAWAKGPAGDAIGFEWAGDGKVAGLRVGAEAFVPQLEFCA